MSVDFVQHGLSPMLWASQSLRSPRTSVWQALKSAACVVSILVVCGVSANASAQRLGGQRFQPAGSEDGILGTEGADKREHFKPYVALWANYAWRPTLLTDAQNDVVGYPVEHALAADLVASLAVWEGLEFGVALPVTLFAGGDEVGVGDAVGVGVGDLTVRAAYRFRLADYTALAIHLPVLLPTSQDDDILTLGLGVKPTLALSQILGELVELVFNVSYLWREDETFLDYEGGQELGARVAARFGFDKTFRTAAVLDVGGTTAVSDMFSAAESPLEGRAGIEHWFGEHWRLAGFAGTGFTKALGAPDLRVGIGVAYGQHRPWRPRPNPTSGDKDGDGVPDADDQCVDEPEDPDGFEDDDGCPEKDNDRDGVADIDDACPRAPETKNGISDDDGCPDRIRVEKGLITTFEPVKFRTDSDEIDRSSYPMLQEIANVLETNPDMEIRVEGHSDSTGRADYNLELSKRRAASVRQFLISHGASRGQVDSEGYGEAKPRDSNRTRKGRARNRRVDFHIMRE